VLESEVLGFFKKKKSKNDSSTIVAHGQRTTSTNVSDDFWLST